jgi:hypothetical protein
LPNATFVIPLSFISKCYGVITPSVAGRGGGVVSQYVLQLSHDIGAVCYMPHGAVAHKTSRALWLFTLPDVKVTDRDMNIACNRASRMARRPRTLSVLLAACMPSVRRAPSSSSTTSVASRPRSRSWPMPATRCESS